MCDFAKRILLPHFAVTELAMAGDVDGVKVSIPGSLGTTPVEYFVAPKRFEATGARRDGKAKWVLDQFRLYPVVINSEGAPWAEANEWFLSRLEGQLTPTMSTFHSNADDLAAYLRFIEDSGLDWTSFPTHKLHRPTYRFHGYLRQCINNNEAAPSTAKRRMSTVIRFYNWLICEGVLVPENAPWVESKKFVSFVDSIGFRQSKTVITTDVSIKTAKQHNIYDEYIDDGGKLRPLSQQEQEWLLNALAHLGNTEMTLIHLMALLTGARIQTVLTFKVRHALLDPSEATEGSFRFIVGPGTGIDTKFDKKFVLHIPVFLYRMLNTYALSRRAKNRRARAKGGDNEDQYLFLSVRGAPMYESKDRGTEPDGSMLRHSKSGQGVRQFVKDRVIPFIRATHSAPKFAYRVHDMRATFGMNLVDHRMKLVDERKATTSQVLHFVMERMGHKSLITTEKYLNYRSRLRVVRAAQDGWEANLEKLAGLALFDKNE